MGQAMSELQEILQAMVAQKDKIKDRRELLLDMGERVVKSVSQQFGCKQDEVAILLLSVDGKHLRFIAPRKFAELGSIPTTKRDSIAVGVLSRRSGDVINNVPMVKHVSFFETIKLRDKPVPIQKMVTTPLLVRGQPVGVAEISRKGESVRDAGPDFTPADLRKAQEVFDGIAPYLAEARPRDY
jgi:hypothetical protein